LVAVLTLAACCASAEDYRPVWRSDLGMAAERIDSTTCRPHAWPDGLQTNVLFYMPSTRGDYYSYDSASYDLQQPTGVRQPTWDATAHSLYYDGVTNAVWTNRILLNHQIGTVAAWLNFAVSNKIQAIYSTCDEATQQYQGILLGLYSSGKLWHYWWGGGMLSDLRGSTVLSTGVWHYVVFTSNGTTTCCWVDGIPETLTSSGGGNNGTWTADIANRDSVCVGALKWTALNYHFNGYVDDLVVLDVTLTGAQVTNAYRIARQVTGR